MQSPKNRTPVPPRSHSGIIQRLTRHQGGNVLPVMAMAIIPLAGLVGGGVDMSRMYLAKARLQQACDAGALAGRKVMGSNAWTANSNAANTAAVQFFNGNFADGAYGTTGRTYAFTENAGRVTGTASVTVPMSIMKVFGISAKTISVTCDAELRLPNTDIMFVLDTTGSMDCRVDGSNCNGDSNTKIAGLRKAVKCFYEVVAKLDVADVSNTDCGGAPATSGTSGVQIRFGFMPYATNVNVGKLLPKTFFANNWSYQTRKRRFHSYVTANGSWSGSTWTPWSSVSVYATHNNVSSSSACTALQPSNAIFYGPENATSTVVTDSEGYNTTTTVRTRLATEPEYSRSYSNSQDRCTISRRTRTRNETRTDVTSPTFRWDYGYLSQPISALKNGTVSPTNPNGWASSFTLLINGTGNNRGTVPKTITWTGCIEERTPTRKLSNYWPIPSDAYDLQIDLMPNQADSHTLWGPALHDLIYIRSSIAEELDSTNDSYSNSGTSFSCPTEARKLASMDATTLQTYVNGITTDGSTYHDIGLLWGARFISPTGIFASENATTSQGGEIERHLIFMTDGETCTMPSNYQAYGYAPYDKRQSDTTPTANTTCPGTPYNLFSTLLNDQVNARFSAVCEAIKGKNITLWVVYFGTTDAATTARMTNCASSGRFYTAANSTALISTFKSIADQISALRLTR